MLLKEAIKAKSNENVICLNDKNRGWVLYTGNNFQIFPYNKKIVNPKSVTILKNRKDWQVADISDTKLKKKLEEGTDVFKECIVNVVSPSNEAW